MVTLPAIEHRRPLPVPIYSVVALLWCVGYVDDILEPRETRRRLSLDLETLSTKKQSNPWKKHGNMPL